ncbi:bacteriorhodopsin [Rubrivirga sp. S365]|uniref:bacteriorhodopsin n=1 Tax=Rubrivirga sp. S365 TaxID=3076080 RepID=UPI0028C9517B|nr:bacteriorhodopsin [Rubrivirga sp. S365]MDT7858054.1 bacteriorhodopsin [Rubrivirga sp. S365]
MATTWYWIGTAAMALGSVVFGIGAAKADHRPREILYTLNFFICLVAFALYLTMAMGYGSFVSADGTKTAWVRYATWGITTPLLLLDLTLIASSRNVLAAQLIGANTFMIGTGLIATLLPEDVRALTWYVVSCGAYLAVAYLLLGPYRRSAVAAHPKSAGAFQRLVAVHVFLWTLYPVVWLISPEGLDVVGDAWEAGLFTVLDVVAKVGFGLLALNTLATVTQNGEFLGDEADHRTTVPRRPLGTHPA